VTPRFTAPRPAGHQAASKRDSSLPGPPAVPGHSAPQVGQLPGPPRARPWWGFCAVAVTLTLVFAVNVAGILAVLVLLGDLADRIGYRTVLLAAVLIAALGSALFAAADSVAMLFLGRFLHGVAVGLALGTGTSALARLHPNKDHSAAAPRASTPTSRPAARCGPPWAMRWC
jgi:MFS family permease